jgi:hypothetical protein
MAGTSELDFLNLGSDYLDGAVERGRDILLTGQVLLHRSQDLACSVRQNQVGATTNAVTRTAARRQQSRSTLKCQALIQPFFLQHAATHLSQRRLSRFGKWLGAKHLRLCRKSDSHRK